MRVMRIILSFIWFNFFVSHSKRTHILAVLHSFFFIFIFFLTMKQVLSWIWMRKFLIFLRLDFLKERFVSKLILNIFLERVLFFFLFQLMRFSCRNLIFGLLLQGEILTFVNQADITKARNIHKVFMKERTLFGKVNWTTIKIFEHLCNFSLFIRRRLKQQINCKLLLMNVLCMLLFSYSSDLIDKFLL